MDWKYEPNKPEDQICDLDIVAEFVAVSRYTPKTTLENVVLNVVACYDHWLLENDAAHYCDVEDTRPYPQNLMISPVEISWFVRDHGGLKEFDYYL